jgi:hypothetical protein
MSENTRKAVITTAQVREALAEYLKIRLENGVAEATPGSLEFDKGMRGKGFATYKGNDVVAQFETKEEAYSFYKTWSDVALEVLEMMANKPAPEATKPSAKRGAAKLIQSADKPAESAA